MSATRERFEQWLQDSGRWDSCDYGRTEIEDLFEAYSAATADMDELLGALREIANPIAFMQADADKQGAKLNGAMAVQLSDSANYLKEIARRALARYGKLEGRGKNGAI